jgi:hypothetical protein
MARPSDYNDVIAEAICEEIASGRSVVQICLDPDFPSETTVYRWLDKHEAFRERYARAREFQAEHYAAEIIQLADTPVEARKITIKPDGGEEVTIGDAVDRTRLQIDARKWYASKLSPKKYGDKLQQEVSGPNGGPVEAKVVIEFVRTKGTNE